MRLVAEMNYERRSRLSGLVVWLLFAYASFGYTQTPAPVAAEDWLPGFWSYETEFAKPLRGEITIERAAESWRAGLAGMTTNFKPDEKGIRFAFADDRGRFRGAMTETGAIRGFWIRPAVTDDPRFPEGSSQSFATPLVLSKAGADKWQGTVRALEDPFTLFLKIERNDQGALIAAFRNPEQNSRGPAMQYLVTEARGKVRFTAGTEPASDAPRMEGERIANPDRLRIHWADLDRDIELTRRAPEQVANFFPRPPGGQAYAYVPPPDLGDGWKTARAGTTGLDEEALKRMVLAIIRSNPADRRPSLIHSLLVAHRGTLVLEEYFFGHTRNTPHDLRSAGKTFSSVLMGAAMREGAKIKPDTKVYELLADMGPFAHRDPRKAEITLAHLMTHSAGLACNDNDDASPGNENTMQTQREQPDWWKYTLNLPMAHAPGKRYAYCSANINLMGAVLTQATGMWLPALFEKHIARPLQFGEWHWNLMPTDEGYLGGGAFLLPRDLLKVGQMYLDGGMWNGKRIVDAKWVKDSTAARIHISPATTGYSQEEFGDYYGEADDALAWHLSNVRSIPVYAATGNGGQQLVVVPDHQLVVVFTGGNYMQGGIWSQWGNNFIGGQIIPAITRR